MSPVATAAAAAADDIQIINVWRDNVDKEFARIRNIVADYPFVAMDTEFPGTVCRPIGNFNYAEFNYATLKANVDMLKLIQVGLTFSDAAGNIAAGGCVWQFNLCDFDPTSDFFIKDSIDLLTKSGINFERNRSEGIEARRFGELLMGSGVVLQDGVRWVTFHSSYDFGYLLKLLTGRNLPDTQEEFFVLVKVFFPILYDIKHLMRYCNSLYGGLNKLGELLGVERIGVGHQAGSDSLLTLRTYMVLKEKYFNGSTEQHGGVLYGLNDVVGQDSLE